MKKLYLILMSAVALTGFGQEVPRQFRVWGGKAPFRYGAENPVLGKRGIASISIPKGWKRAVPDTNLQKPSLPEKFKDTGFLPFAFHPMRFVYNCTQPRNSEIDLPVRAVATPGEYVPLTFAVRTLKPLNCVEVRLAPFCDKSGKPVIPLINQDLRRIMDLPAQTTEAKQYQLEPRFLESFDEFDMLNLPANHTERFWLTVKVPDDAEPGIVKADLAFVSRNGGKYAFRAAIRILPFKLAVPDPEKEMSFAMLANTNDSRTASWGRSTDPRLQVRNMIDMVEHGMNTSSYEHANPYVAYGADGKLIIDFDRPGPTSYFAMNDFLYNVRRAGFTGPFCYYSGPYEWASYIANGVLKNQKYDDKYNEALREMARAVREQSQKMNWPEFIFVLADEPAGHPDRIKQNLNLGEQIRKGAPGIRTSNFFNGGWFGINDWRLLRKVTDINCTNYATEATMKDARACGYDRIWLYNGARNYPGDTRGYRLFYGFVPWRYQARGVSQYIYSGFSHSLSNVNNDLAAYDILHGGNPYDFVYPTSSGPLPTPKWEAVRQGTYDYRYLLTLKKMMDKAPAEARARAQAVLDEINSKFFTDYMSQAGVKQIENYAPETLDAYRWKVSRAIMNLQKEMK